MAANIHNEIFHHKHPAILYKEWQGDTWHYPILQSLVSLNVSLSFDGQAYHPQINKFLYFIR